LKTPLAAISGLLDQPQPNRAEIRQAVRRLTRTVDLLLDATRIDSGLLKPSVEWCEPGELAGESITLSGLPDGAVRCTRAAGIPAIRVDAGLVAQAIAMVLSNAAAHSPADVPIELHVAHDGGGVIFSVLDRGPGIPPGEEENIFARFHRGAGAKPGGLGLGLAIARQLAQLHGGTLRAQNRPGGGAIFSLRVPATEQMRLPDEPAA
jgi:two-component system sensor histidine kinase KdpD